MTRIGRYDVVGHIAVGDRKDLMLGRERSGRPVAIKRVPRDAHTSQTRHPNLVAAMEVVPVGQDSYLVMEYLEGENLAGLIRRLIKRRERISYGLAAHIIAEVCDGLHAAHVAGELHRAVTPQNVFITYGGDVKLAGLGIAVIDPDSPYQSPEQTAGQPLGRQSDVYSLGLVLYELTTLHRVFAGAGDDRPVPQPSTQAPDYPSELESLTMHAIEPDPAHRFLSAHEMHVELLSCASKLGIDADPSQALASKLMRLFGDRVAMKRELLDRLRTGMSLGDLVPTDVDEEIEIPLVARPANDGAADVRPQELDLDEELRTDPAKARPITKPMGSPDPRPAPRASRPPLQAALPAAIHAGFRWGVALLFVAAIGVGGAAGGWLRLRNSSSAVPVTVPADARIVHVPPPDAAPTLPEMVTITVESVPAGAKVVVDGDDRGVTPIDLRIHGALKPLAVELRRDGFQPTRLDIIPDRDRTIHEKLARAIEP